jgi:hypothetical protein
VKEIPILMQAEMVRATLEDRKTQTRRVIKPQPRLGKPWKSGWIVDPDEMDLPIAFCPHGIPGDHLWVRETWAIPKKLDSRRQYNVENWHPILYRADKHIRGKFEVGRNWLPSDFGKWRPSIFMPRWASRITLEVTGIRVERVQDITPDDAGAEGIFIDLPNAPLAANFGRVAKFRELWDKINAKPKPVYRRKQIVAYVSYPWDDVQETWKYRGKPWYVTGNPWVWVITFRRIAAND